MKQGLEHSMINAVVTGTLGRDAELRDTSFGSVLSFSIASERKSKGERVTTWVGCSLFGKRGEALAQYLLKGTRVAVSGELTTREHNGKTYLDVRVDQLELMGGGQRERKEEKSEEYNDDIPF